MGAGGVSAGRICGWPAPPGCVPPGTPGKGCVLSEGGVWVRALREPRLRTWLTVIGRPSWSPGDLRRLLQPARPQGQPLAALWLLSLELMRGDTLEGTVG